MMRSQIVLYYVIIMVACYLNSSNLVLISGDTVESPEYTVVHSESDFEIRLYQESSWMSDLVQGTSFEKSTKDGFHRLYQYIHGANLNSTRLTMTAPVLTSIKPSSHGSLYLIRYYLPAKYEKSPPQPSPELNLQLDKRSSQCVAVRKFSGFAKDDNIDKEMEALVSSLSNHLSTGKAAVMEDGKSYTIAQYNSPYHLSGRLNEVWMNVSGFTAEGCPRYQLRK